MCSADVCSNEVVLPNNLERNNAQQEFLKGMLSRKHLNGAFVNGGHMRTLRE